jgi:hypothetical protein
MFYVDVDDPNQLDTLNAIHAYDGHVVTGERIVLSEMWNVCAKAALNDVMMHCGDDIIFRSNGWDQRVLDTFDDCDDKILFVHGNDLSQQGQLGTHGFLHRRWTDAVGYFVPPYFSSDMNDLWLTEVADTLGRRCYLSDVITEHMHPLFGKGEWDQTHQERLTRHSRDDVAALYQRLAPERANDVVKLQAVINGDG